MTTRAGAGPLLKQWRTRRRFSQLDLAAEAGVSQRHLSFMETGRSTPSREMLVHLGEVLQVPLRDRNSMLSAAGYAPVYRERSPDDPEMAPIRTAVELMIERHDPYPAFAIDRHWNVLRTTEATGRMMRQLSAANPDAAPQLVLPVHVKKGDFEVRTFSTLTTIGSPLDITVSELMIELLFPADEESDRVFRALADAD